MKNNPHQAWQDQRQTLEQGRFEATPDGLIRQRMWSRLDPAFRPFGHLLRLLGLHDRGMSNALNIKLKPLSVELASLPPAFDGYRILHISDPHLDLLPGLAERTAALVNGVSADLMLLGGDYRDRFEDSPELGLDLLRPILAASDPPDGRIAILGNHDPASAVPILEEMGVRVLLNQTLSIKRGEDVLHLTGLDDVHRFYSEAALSALNEPFSGCRIVAVHSAEAADLAAAAGIDLYLCGHTHGGQIRLPRSRPLISHLRRCRAYSHGQWLHGDMLGYTSNGAGVSGIPIRFNCPPEVTLITLRRPGSALANTEGP